MKPVMQGQKVEAVATAGSGLEVRQLSPAQLLSRQKKTLATVDTKAVSVQSFFTFKSNES